MRIPIPIAALILLALGWSGPASLHAVEVRIDNPAGEVRVRIVTTGKLHLRQSSPTRPVRREDVRINRTERVVALQVLPSDGARVDLDVDLPFGTPILVKTFDTKISIEGFIALATLITERGEIEIAAPWEAVRLLMIQPEKPLSVETPKGFKFSQETVQDGERASWVLRDRLKPGKVTYGRVRIRSQGTQKLTLRHTPIPADSPVKLAWQAEQVVAELLREAKQEKRRRQRVRRGARRARPAPDAPDATERLVEEGIAVADGTVRFSSQVRLVSLAAAVTDAADRPLPGLDAEDFQVFEDGVEQEIEFAGTEEAPFNLAILLDLSASTRQARAEMKTAARRFVETARPRDSVAAYALANNMFMVISGLTHDRERLAKTIDNLPPLSGGSPIYDAIALAYAQELGARRGERNALIVLSDGADNRLHGDGTPSKISFKTLREAAGHMDALLYPIFLGADPAAPPQRGWPRTAYKRFEKLAEVTGGKMFAARSVQDLDPVYAQVAAELRSVYSVAYYPKNQNFDGSWRAIEIRVKRPGAAVRARGGYIAR